MLRAEGGTMKPREADSAWKLYLMREWSHAVPNGERQQDAGVARRIEAQQQRPWTAANVHSGRSPFTVVRSHGSKTAREHISSHRVGQTHDKLLEHLELRKKNVRADSDGVVLLPDTCFTRLGSARAQGYTTSVEKLQAAAGAQEGGARTNLGQQRSAFLKRAVSVEGSESNEACKWSKASPYVQDDSKSPATSAIRGDRLHRWDQHEHLPPSAIGMQSRRTATLPVPMKRATCGTTHGGVSWTRVASSDSRASPEDPLQTSCAAPRQAVIERRGSSVWTRVSSTPWSWEPSQEQAEVMKACCEKDAGASSRPSRLVDTDGHERERAQGNLHVSSMAAHEDTIDHHIRTTNMDEQLISAKFAPQNSDTNHAGLLGSTAHGSAVKSKQASASSGVKHAGSQDPNVKWQRGGMTGEKLFRRYADKGKVNSTFSSLKRQIIIIDDRKPLTQDMLGVCGNLALPDKKVPSAVAVRERERERALRDLADLSNRFIRDRINGGPTKRRDAALGANSHSLAHLKQQLQGVQEAVCPTCADEIEPHLRDSFAIQMLLDKQESWEDDGCFGDAPSVVCSHNHEHTTYAILFEAAAARSRRSRGDDAKVRSSQPTSKQMHVRHDNDRQQGPRPGSLSAWSTGDEESHVLLGMQDADGQRLADQDKTSSCASVHKAQMGMSKEVVQAGEGWLNGKGKARVRGEEGRRGGDRQSNLVKTVLKPHPPQAPKEKGTPKTFARTLDEARRQLERNSEGKQEADADSSTAVRRRHGGDTGEGVKTLGSFQAQPLPKPGSLSSGVQSDGEWIGDTSFADKLKSEVEMQADELLRQKLLQLEDCEAGEQPEEVAEDFPFDPNAEVVRHFGMEMRLSSMGAVTALIVREIEKRHGTTSPSVADLLQIPEKREWVRMWVRAEGCGSALKFIFQSDIGGSQSAGAAGSAKPSKRATQADGSNHGASSTGDQGQESLADRARQTKETIKAGAKLMLLNPLEGADYKHSPADNWTSAKNKMRGALANMHWSRRDKQAGQQAKATKDQVIFQQVTFFRLNPLGVRGHKDLMVV